MDNIKVFALGGLDENGRDCYVVEINNDIFVIDAGASLPDKTLPGIDFILPNPDYLIKNKTRVKAYLITHGHDESIGALKYFYDLAPAPIYCTFVTSGILKTQASIHHIKTNFQFKIVNASDTQIIAGHTVHFFQTCHNMAYSCGIAIETDRGNIVYTGDFIVDYTISEPGYAFDLNKLSIIAEKPTLLLIAESKTAMRSGYCSPKHRIRKVIEKYFRDNKRIFITSFWQNFYRIQEIAQLCRDYKKKVYFYDEYTRNTIEQFNSYLPLFDKVEIVSPSDLLRVRAQDTVVLILGHDITLYSEINNLCQGKNEDKRLSLTKDDIFICSALPIPTMEIANTRSIDNLYRTGCEVVQFKGKEVISMHAQQDDLRLMLTLLKPKYYLPNRGSYRNIMANAKLALSTGVGLTHMSVFVIDNGMQVVFEGEGRPRIVPNEVNGINVAPLLVDGRGLTNINTDVVEERKKLGVDGAVVVAAVVSKSKGEIIAGPDCQMRGFVYVKEAEPLLKSISNIFVDEINTAIKAGTFDVKKVQEIVADRATKFVRRENGREPYILPIITIVD